jgi:hypothetical protein
MKDELKSNPGCEVYSCFRLHSSSLERARWLGSPALIVIGKVVGFAHEVARDRFQLRTA